MSTDSSRAVADSPHTEPDRPGETEAQRDDRNVMELLNELRAFTNHFSKLYTAQRGVYLAR